MNLPTGTVTLFFADIDRGSGSLPDAAASALPAAPLWQALRAHNGTILTIDDESLRASFATAEEALSAAVAIQQSSLAHQASPGIGSIAPRMRIALHTDRVQAEGQYIGTAVERIFKLLAAGHGGQILVSADCARALQGRGPAGVQLRNLGEFPYDGPEADGEVVFEVSHAGVSAEFPPLRVSIPAATNLPSHWTSFIGRESELLELKQSLHATRILTLIGADGIGKSRLAVRLASDLRSAFPDGVWVAELPSIADIDLVPGVLGRALNAQLGPDVPLSEALAALLHSRKMLLVLDVGSANTAACARLVTALLGACPAVKFIVCARKGLGLRDETIYCVPGLNFSAAEEGADAERLCRDRAAHLPTPLDFGGPVLTELCYLLNGLPLALELAIGALAADPEERLLSLNRSIGDLTGGLQHSWEETLELVLDWSYARLSETERILLERLSVFQGGWSLEAATAIVCDAALPADLLTEPLESLRAKAFLTTEQRAGFTRERLCDAVRNYAEARLTRRGEAFDVRRRHADYFLMLAEQGALGLAGTEREGWRAYLEREYLNFRSALLCLHQETAARAQELRLATALLPVLTAGGRSAEGRTLLKRATEANHAAAIRPDDYPTTRAHYVTAIDRCRATTDRATEVRYLDTLARLALSQSDFVTAMRCCERAAEVFRELGDPVQEARMLHRLGSAARDGGEVITAQNHYLRALELNRALGRHDDEAHNLNGLARVALMQGDPAEAVRRFEEGLLLFRELGERAWEAHNMGQILRLSLPSEPLWERTPLQEGVVK
jgi:predicted ATPase/class 3 adenylate cyclase